MTTIPELQEKLAYNILSNKYAEPEAKIKIVAIAVYWLEHEQKEQKAADLYTKAVEIIGKNCSEMISLIHEEIDASLEKAFSGKNGVNKYRGKR